MSEDMEGMFQKIPFEEAYAKTMEHDRQLKAFKAQGAVLEGERELDKSYTAFARRAAEYQMQFSEAELCALLGKSLEEKQ